MRRNLRVKHCDTLAEWRGIAGGGGGYSIERSTRQVNQPVVLCQISNVLIILLKLPDSSINQSNDSSFVVTMYVGTLRHTRVARLLHGYRSTSFAGGDGNALQRNLWCLWCRSLQPLHDMGKQRKLKNPAITAFSWLQPFTSRNVRLMLIYLRWKETMYHCGNWPSQAMNSLDHAYQVPAVGQRETSELWHWTVNRSTITCLFHLPIIR